MYTIGEWPSTECRQTLLRKCCHYYYLLYHIYCALFYNILTPQGFPSPQFTGTREQWSWCQTTTFTWSTLVWNISFLSSGETIFGCDSSPRSSNVSLLVCVSVCLSHLLQLYWTSEGLPKDFWRTLVFMVYKVYTNYCDWLILIWLSDVGGQTGT